MATFRKNKKTWTAQIFKKGVRTSASFATKREATEWAAMTEAEILTRDFSQIPDKTFGDLLMRYREEVVPHKKGARWEKVRIVKLLRDPIAKVALIDFGKKDVTKWRDRSLENLAASSVLREWSILSHACTIARRDWDWLKENPFFDVTKPKNGRSRTRRPTDDENERILYSLGYEEGGSLKSATARVGAMWLFAIETAMRAGEIVNLTWEHVHLDESYVHVADSKNGYARDVPLSSRAKEIIEMMIGVDEERVFSVASNSRDALFRKARDRALIEDLHFHDSRREALSRLAKKMDVLQLARISGHRDLRVLQNTYYAPKVSDLVALVA